MRTGFGPMGVLVLAQIERLRSAEADLARTLSTFTGGKSDEVSELSFVSSLAEVQNRAQRLERVLEAMACCGYPQVETWPALAAA